MLKDYLFYFEDEEEEGYTFFVETEEDKDTAIKMALDIMEPTGNFTLEYHGSFTPEEAGWLGYNTY